MLLNTVEVLFISLMDHVFRRWNNIGHWGAYESQRPKRCVVRVRQTIDSSMQCIAAGSIVIDTYTVRSVGRKLEALGNTYEQLQ